MDRAAEEKAEVKSLEKEQLWAEEPQRSRGWGGGGISEGCTLWLPKVRQEGHTRTVFSVSHPSPSLTSLLQTSLEVSASFPL